MDLIKFSIIQKFKRTNPEIMLLRDDANVGIDNFVKHKRNGGKKGSGDR